MTRITSGLSPFTDAAEIAEDHDLAGRTVVITGAATGIGIETARALAAAGTEVTIAVRNREAGENAAAGINADIGEDRV